MLAYAVVRGETVVLLCTEHPVGEHSPLSSPGKAPRRESAEEQMKKRREFASCEGARQLSVKHFPALVLSPPRARCDAPVGLVRQTRRKIVCCAGTVVRGCWSVRGRFGDESRSSFARHPV